MGRAARPTRVNAKSDTKSGGAVVMLASSSPLTSRLYSRFKGRVAELADARDLKSRGE